jgi:3-dehydroquinate synthase
MSYYCKSKIVAADPKEQGLRKALNLGHTIGHALERMCLAKGTPLPHGYAVAAGIMGEAHSGYARGVMTEHLFYEIEETIFSTFPAVQIGDDDLESIYGFALQDKKNKAGQIGCSLLHAPGKVDVEAMISQEEIDAAIAWYRGEQVPEGSESE